MAAPETFHFFAPEFLQQVPNHVEADAGTFLLQIGHAEFAGLPLDGVEDERRLRTARAFAGVLVKFGARATDDGEFFPARHEREFYRKRNGRQFRVV